MCFESKFTLNRQHFEECYDQSLPFSKNKGPRFKIMTLLIVTALTLLFFTEQLNHLAFFLIALAMIEFVSFRYRRGWWLTRQVWSKNSGNHITLLIDNKGIETQSVYINNQLYWKEINHLIETDKGLMLTLNNNSLNYISKTHLDDNAISFIKQQVNH